MAVVRGSPRGSLAPDPVRITVVNGLGILPELIPIGRVSLGTIWPLEVP